MRHNAWRTMRLEHPDWRIHFALILPRGAHGLTRWRDRTVWLLSDLTQVERRCVLEHERQHILRGPVLQDDLEEDFVEQPTARSLVPPDALVGVAKWRSGRRTSSRRPTRCG